MNIHQLRNLEENEQVKIEAIMAEFEETHRTFEHLVYDIEQLEELTESLKSEPDGTARMRMIKRRGGNKLVADLNATLNRLLHDEQSLLKDSKRVRHAVAHDILDAIQKFEKHR